MIFFFPYKSLYFRDISNVTQQCRCSYFELGLPVVTPFIGSGRGHAIATKQTTKSGRQQRLSLIYFIEKKGNM